MRTASILVAAALVAVSHSANAAQPIELKWGFPAPPTSWVLTKGINGWIKEVESASGHAIDVQVFPGGKVANFRNVYDRLMNHVIDMGFGTYGPINDIYIKTSVATLPFEVESVHELGPIVWRLHETGALGDEYKAVKPLAVFTFGRGVLHSTVPIEKLSDLDGMKVIASSPLTAQCVKLLGGVPITMTPSQMYQGLQRGTAKATQISWGGAQVFKIDEVAKHHTDIGFGHGMGYFFMNKDSFAKLPGKARKAIDAASGAKFTREMAEYATAEETSAISHIMGERGQHRYKLSKADIAHARQAVHSITEHWVTTTPDGQHVLDAFRAEVKRVESGS